MMAIIVLIDGTALSLPLFFSLSLSFMFQFLLVGIKISFRTGYPVPRPAVSGTTDDAWRMHTKQLQIKSR